MFPRRINNVIMCGVTLFQQQSSTTADQNTVIDDDTNFTMEQIHTVKRLGWSRKKRNIVDYSLNPALKWPVPANTIKYKFHNATGNVNS